MIMEASTVGEHKRWFRVGQSVESWRFVDVFAECECLAIGLVETLDDSKFQEVENDEHWKSKEIEQIEPDDVWNPAA